MKSQTYITLILLFLINLSSNSQVTPIISTSNDDYSIYKTSLYNQYLQTINTQSYELKEKISAYRTRAIFRTNSGFKDTFFQSVLSVEHFNTLRNNRGKETRFNIRYVLDETGSKVYSCALYFPKGLVVLSDTEIEAILTDAMTHQFDYTKKPKDNSSFYYLSIYGFAI